MSDLHKGWSINSFLKIFFSRRVESKILHCQIKMNALCFFRQMDKLCWVKKVQENHHNPSIPVPHLCSCKQHGESRNGALRQKYCIASCNITKPWTALLADTKGALIWFCGISQILLLWLACVAFSYTWCFCAASSTFSRLSYRTIRKPVVN